MTIARDRWEEDGCKLSAGECLNPEGVSFHQGQPKNSRLMSRERSVTDDLPVLCVLRGYILNGAVRPAGLYLELCRAACVCIVAALSTSSTPTCTNLWKSTEKTQLLWGKNHGTLNISESPLLHTDSESMGSDSLMQRRVSGQDFHHKTLQTG